MRNEAIIEEKDIEKTVQHIKENIEIGRVKGVNLWNI